MIKVIQVGDKWTWKEVSEEGNSIRAGVERFDTEKEVTAFIAAFPDDKELEQPMEQPPSIDDIATANITPINTIPVKGLNNQDE